MTTFDSDVHEALMAMDDDGFKDVVTRDVRDNDSSVVDEDAIKAYTAALRSRQLVERWYQCLVRMKKSTELTIAAKSIDSKAMRSQLERKGDQNKAENERYHFLRWKAGAIRFLTGVEVRLAEASYCRRVHFANGLPDHVAAERDALSESVRALREAIRQHREAFSPDEEPNESDLMLWRTLEGDGSS